MTVVTTESGTRYEFNKAMTRVRREGGHTLRRDGEWLGCTLVGEPLVGLPLNFILEPLGAASVTIRTTSAVVSIEEES